ncbi:hypothetical protein KY334_02605 [Candidatus Woesearchaeota archaeon]|nr:hypothetical protein [Candidatus Woesearchaeota archaeon]
MNKVISVSYYSYVTNKRQSISLFVIEEYKKSYLVNHPYYGEIEVMKDGSENEHGVSLNKENE